MSATTRAQANELRVSALRHAIDCYAGPDDDTLPVLRHWLRDLQSALGDLHNQEEDDV